MPTAPCHPRPAGMTRMLAAPAEPSKPGLARMLGAPALAGGMAVCFSHPLELTKVRLQLDNERAAHGVRT